MNEYSEGSLETLAWIRKILNGCTTLEEYTAARVKIDQTFQIVAKGTAQSFQDKVEILETELKNTVNEVPRKTDLEEREGKTAFETSDILITVTIPQKYHPLLKALADLSKQDFHVFLQEWADANVEGWVMEELDDLESSYLIPHFDYLKQTYGLAED